MHFIVQQDGQTEGRTDRLTNGQRLFFIHVDLWLKHMNTFTCMFISLLHLYLDLDKTIFIIICV